MCAPSVFPQFSGSWKFPRHTFCRIPRTYGEGAHCYNIVTKLMQFSPQSNAVLISVLQEHSENRVLTGLSVQCIWQPRCGLNPMTGWGIFWGCLLCVCNLPCSRALTTGSWRQKCSPCIVYCIASVGRRLVTHKQSHQRNWLGTL